MSNFRSRWLAALAGTTLLALSLSSALGHNPNAGTNTGPEDSVVVQGQVGDVAETTGDQTGDQTGTNTQVDEGQPSDHGACVSEVAHSEDVGGKNENHGGAVSEAAQVTCAQDATDAGQTEVQANDSDDAEVNQTDQSDSGNADAKDHNDGNESDSSED